MADREAPKEQPSPGESGDDPAPAPAQQEVSMPGPDKDLEKKVDLHLPPKERADLR